MQEMVDSHRGFSFSSRASEAVDVDRVQEQAKTAEMSKNLLKESKRNL